MHESTPSTFQGRLIQTAFITDDIHASMRELTRTLGAGPWFLRERGVFPKQVYRGQPSQTALAIALGYAGDMQFEIIQQLDDSPSVYRDQFERSGYGLHHFGMATTDGDRSRAGLHLSWPAGAATRGSTCTFPLG